MSLCHVMTRPVWGAACSQPPHSRPPAQGDCRAQARSGAASWPRPPRGLSAPAPAGDNPHGCEARHRLQMGLWVEPAVQLWCGLGGPRVGAGPDGLGVLGHTGSVFMSGFLGAQGPVSTGNLPARERLQRVPKATRLHFFQRTATPGSGTHSRESLHSAPGSPSEF